MAWVPIECEIILDKFLSHLIIHKIIQLYITAVIVNRNYQETSQYVISGISN